MIRFSPVGVKFEETLVASGGEEAMVLEVIKDEEESFNNIPAVPPAEWFSHSPAHNKAYSIQFEQDGRIHGYASAWGLTHIGYLDQDVYTPRSETNYARFRTGSVLLDDGSTIATGRLVMNTVHPKKRAAAQNGAQAFYDYSGAAIADVTVYEDEFGIYLAGSARPSATDEQMRIARGSDWSPDWRSFNNNLEMVALLAVNVSGFVVDGLVASGGIPEGTDTEDFCMPGDLYCEFSADGNIETLIGNHFKAEEEPVEETNQELLERVKALEAFVETLKSERDLQELDDLILE